MEKIYKYGWNKLTTRKATEEEKEFYGNDFMWEGKIPELFEEVIVTEGKDCGFMIDTWTEFDKGVGFECTDADTVYWLRIPKPDLK
ncbi:MAG: hypothetical protein SOR31_03540 [Parvimonas sp.]|uniref:hypothetical protein n=1 Tax=Parvimonas sp. TaxID=1944660 RepID=UPI002A765767|nr:hypothetical protein [Parvimonas sp.]MDY3050690.1 hypothetical protein [Parvimonas sp.]